jgi:hypothetical protein
VDLQSGLNESREYHNDQLEDYSLSKFGFWRKLHTLDMTKDDKDRLER